jgi:hypothetical protein
MVDAARTHHNDVYPKAEAIDPRAWGEAHGAPKLADDPRFAAGPMCWDLRDHVGEPGLPGLLCEQVKDGTTTATVLRLEHQRLAEAWSGAIATHGWLELTPLLSRDGGTLTVVDVTPSQCDCALAEYDAKAASSVDPGFGEVLRAGCAGRGEYAWDGKRYTRPASVSGLGRCSSEPARDTIELP